MDFIGSPTNNFINLINKTKADEEEHIPCGITCFSRTEEKFSILYRAKNLNYTKALSGVPNIKSI